MNVVQAMTWSMRTVQWYPSKRLWNIPGRQPDEPCSEKDLREAMDISIEKMYLVHGIQMITKGGDNAREEGQGVAPAVA